MATRERALYQVRSNGWRDLCWLTRRLSLPFPHHPLLPTTVLPPSSCFLLPSPLRFVSIPASRFLPDARKSSGLKIFKSSRLAPFKTRARNQDRIKTPSFKTTLNTQDSSKSQAACKSISYSSLSSVSDVMSAFPPFWPPCSFNARGEDVVMITVALPCIYGPG
ncbi:hypothetical protein DFH09DRAFT_1270695 [Mycena vulgaris]|nr:hypothetical protein DFH09DRAFT_1270695 [Mycena vulgaris]